MTNIKKKMNEVLDNFKTQISGLRTGRAHVALLQNVKVNVQGQFMPINHLAHVSVMDYQTLCVSVWDPSNSVAMEAAINNTVPGVTTKARSHQDIIVSVPPMSEDRRAEMCKILVNMSEQTKIKIRNIRRQELDQLREDCKNSDITEDDLAKSKQDLQKDTDEFVKNIDRLIADKKQEIMTV